MSIPENKHTFLSAIARAADLSMKPFLHAVLDYGCSNSDEKYYSLDDLILRIECRDNDGRRLPSHDMDLEIYKSGNDVSIMLYKVDTNEKSILWHGKHSVWMDGDSGLSCKPPKDAEIMESFARRLNALIGSHFTE